MDDSHLMAIGAKAAIRARKLYGDGRQSGFGQLLGITQQAVSQRERGGLPLQSNDEVLKVEAATGVSRHDLRPDIYPREDSPRAPAGASGLDSAGGHSSPAPSPRGSAAPALEEVRT